MWKSIPSIKHYQCNKNGQIRRRISTVHFGKQKRVVGGTILSPKTKKNGYQEVNLYPLTGRSKSYYVHRLIAETWLGEIPPKMSVNHKDFDKTNNSVSNLEIVSYSENSRHAYINGRIKPKPLPGSLHPRSKTNEKEVKKIRKEHDKHHSLKRLVDDYPHLSKGTLAKIIYKETWRHV